MNSEKSLLWVTEHQRAGLSLTCLNVEISHESLAACQAVIRSVLLHLNWVFVGHGLFILMYRWIYEKIEGIKCCLLGIVGFALPKNQSWLNPVVGSWVFVLIGLELLSGDVWLFSLGLKPLWLQFNPITSCPPLLWGTAGQKAADNCKHPTWSKEKTV